MKKNIPWAEIISRMGIRDLFITGFCISAVGLVFFYFIDDRWSTLLFSCFVIPLGITVVGSGFVKLYITDPNNRIIEATKTHNNVDYVKVYFERDRPELEKAKKQFYLKIQSKIGLLAVSACQFVEDIVSAEINRNTPVEILLANPRTGSLLKTRVDQMVAGGEYKLKRYGIDFNSNTTTKGERIEFLRCEILRTILLLFYGKNSCGLVTVKFHEQIPFMRAEFYDGKCLFLSYYDKQQKDLWTPEWKYEKAESSLNTDYDIFNSFWLYYQNLSNASSSPHNDHCTGCLSLCGKEKGNRQLNFNVIETLAQLKEGLYPMMGICNSEEEKSKLGQDIEKVMEELRKDNQWRNKLSLSR